MKIKIRATSIKPNKKIICLNLDVIENLKTNKGFEILSKYCAINQL